VSELERPLTSGQVADIFGVSPETVAGWANEGKLAHFRTPGGQRRFHRADVDRFLEANSAAAGEVTP
jgi:excisionase family DNA binding protein